MEKQRKRDRGRKGESEAVFVPGGMPGRAHGRKEEKPLQAQRPKRREPQRESEPRELPEDVLIGRNAVLEALKSGRGINKLLLAQGELTGSAQEILALAKEQRVLLERVERSKIEAVAGGLRHQGVLAYVAPVPYAELEDILAKTAAKDEPPFLLLLDELEDPHNLGALLRTADAAGVDGVIIPKRRSCPLSATVAKTSAGAVEYVPVARVANVVQTLEELKKHGFWAVGADMDGEQLYDEADLTGALVLVIGSEGRGISRLTKEHCDFLVQLPMLGKVNSLNASVAGAILIYEALRQRRRKK